MARHNRNRTSAGSRRSPVVDGGSYEAVVIGSGIAGSLAARPLVDATRLPPAGDTVSRQVDSVGEYQRIPALTYVLGALMVALGVVTAFLIFAGEITGGYDLLFLYSIPANTAISPFPHEPVLFYYGKHANLLLVTVVATAGNLVAGYLDYRVFVPILNHRRITGYKGSWLYRKASDLFMRYPFSTLAVTSLTPIPFFPFKFLAFSVRYSLSLYLAAIAVSRLPRYWFLAWVGMAVRIPDWVLVGLIVGIFATYAVKGVPAVWRHICGHQDLS